MKSKRSFYIALILLLGVALTIGYAVLSQTLSIKGTTGIASNSWIIYFDNLVERPGTLTPSTPTTINDKKDKIDFTISLDKPGDNYTFEVDIINDGTIDAMIDTVSLTGIPESLDGIVEWNVNYLTGDELRKCDELLANTSRRIKVVVNYNKDIDELPEEQELDLQLSVKYVQLDNSICTTTNPPSGPDPVDLEDGRYTLTIDPNDGIYKGTDAIKALRMAPGEVYIFGDDPVQEVHTFTGWTADDDEIDLSTIKMITMPENDVTATANWTWDIVDEENDLGYCFQVGNNYYTTFYDAMSNFVENPTNVGSYTIPLQETGTIKLLHSGCHIYVGGNYSINIPSSLDLTLDLNGKTGNGDTYWENYGTVRITDSSDSKDGKYTFYDSNNTNNSAFNNRGSIYISDVNMETSSLVSSYEESTITSINKSNIWGFKTQLISTYGGELVISDTKLSGYSRVAVYANADTNTITNTTIDLENSNNFQAIYSSKGTLNLDSIEINIKNGGGTTNYGVFASSLFNIKNIYIYMSNMTGSTHGVYTTSTTGSLENINVEFSDIESSQSYGIFSSSTDIDTANINISGSVGDLRGIYNVKGDYKNVTINLYTDTGFVRGVSSENNITFDNINIKAITTANKSETSTGLEVKSVESLTNSNIEVLAPNMNYTYGVNSYRLMNNQTIDNVYIKLSSKGTAYGMYLDSNSSGITTEITNTNIDIATKAQGYGIYTGVPSIISDVDIDVQSERIESGVSPYSNVIGVYSYSTTSISDSDIKVNGNYTNELDNNEYVYAVYLSKSNAEYDITNTNIESSAVCFYNRYDTSSINLDNSSNLTCPLGEQVGNGVLNKE